MVGEFGQGFGGRNPHAGRDADPLADPLPYLLPVDGQILVGEAPQVDETLVYRVNLLPWAELADDRHHPPRQIPVESVVAGQHHDPVLPHNVPHLEQRHPHADAQRLGLVRSGHHAAVVVRQHHHRPSLEPGVEHPLTGDVKVVAVDQGKY